VTASSCFLRCIIVTPQRPVADEKADFVAFTAHDGQYGILPRRSPLLCKLDCGFVRIERRGRKQWYYISGGFAQVADNKVVITSPEAMASSEIDYAAVDEQLDDLAKEPPGSQRGGELLRQLRMKHRLAADYLNCRQ